MRSLLALATLSGTILGAGSAYACSCRPVNSATELLSYAEVVFVGRAKVSSSAGFRTGRAITTFQIMRTLKGQAQSKVRVGHYTKSPACGMRFTKGETYLVLAYVSKDRLSTNLCLAPRLPLSEFEQALQPPAP